MNPRHPPETIPAVTGRVLAGPPALGAGTLGAGTLGAGTLNPGTLGAGTSGPETGAMLEADLQAHIGRQLRAVYEDVVNEPVPDRFVALLEELARKKASRE